MKEDKYSNSFSKISCPCSICVGVIRRIVLHLSLENFVWGSHVGVTPRGPKMRAVTKRNIVLCVGVCFFFFLKKKGVIPLGLNETHQFFSFIPSIYT